MDSLRGILIDSEWKVPSDGPVVASLVPCSSCPRSLFFSSMVPLYSLFYEVYSSRYDNTGADTV